MPRRVRSQTLFTDEALHGRLLVLELLATRQLGRIPGAEILFDEVAEILRGLLDADGFTAHDGDRKRVERIFTAAQASCEKLRSEVAAAYREKTREHQS